MTVTLHMATTHTMDATATTAAASTMMSQENTDGTKPLPSMLFDQYRPRTLSSPSSRRKHVFLQPTADSPPPSSTADQPPHCAEQRSAEDIEHKAGDSNELPASSSCSPSAENDSEDDGAQTEGEDVTCDNTQTGKFYIPSIDDIPTGPESDLNNNEDSTDSDTDSEAKPKKPRRWMKAFEPGLHGIEEEERELIPSLMRRVRSDTLYGEELSGVALLVQQEMQNYTRYRCLSQVDKWPSQRMYSKFYSSRPYLLVYTRWLANEGIYRSTSISIKNNPGLGRRVSSCPGTVRRRSSLLPGTSDSGSRISWRRSSLIPDITKFLTGSTTKISEQGDMTPRSSVSDMGSTRASTAAINLDDFKLVQLNYEKNQKKKKGGVFDIFICCVSKKSRAINDDDDDDALPY